MPFALIVIGIILIVTGAQNTHLQMGAQLRKDFTGEGNFIYWVAAIGSVGALGYVDALRPLSRAFMTLLVVGILIANPKFFTELSTAIKAGPIAPEGQAAYKGTHDTSMADVKKTETVAIEQHEKAQQNFGTFMKIITTIFGGGPAF